MTLDQIDADLIEPQRLAACVIDTLKAEKRQRTPPVGAGLSAREALKALRFEALLICVSAGNLLQGLELSADDLERMALAWQRIDTIMREAGL